MFTGEGITYACTPGIFFAVNIIALKQHIIKFEDCIITFFELVAMTNGKLKTSCSKAGRLIGFILVQTKGKQNSIF